MQPENNFGSPSDGGQTPQPQYGQSGQFVSRPTPPPQPRMNDVAPQQPFQQQTPVQTQPIQPTSSLPQAQQIPPVQQQPLPQFQASTHDMPRPQPLPASAINKHRNRLIFPLVLAVLLLLAAAGFGYWAFTSRQDYKNNVDTKVEEATGAAVSTAVEAKEQEFKEREKLPLKQYKGPSAFGSVNVSYPKTWAGYVIESEKGSTPVNGYFHPNFVPDVQGSTAFALRVEVLNEAYDKALARFDSDSKRGTVKVSAIKAAKVPNVTGARVDGQIESDKRGSVVLFPLRDKTLRLTVESEDFVGDFNTIILDKLTFTP